MITKWHNFTWLLPTIGFLIGYGLVRIGTTSKSSITPQLIGNSLSTACHQVSPSTNGLKIIATRTDPSLPPDTILDQIPRSGSPLRPYQYIYITVSTAPPLPVTTDEYKIPITYTKNISERIGTYSTPQKTIVYTPFIADTRVILPNYRGTLITALKQELELRGYTIKVVHRHPLPHHLCTTCTVLEQDPPPGSIIREKEPITLIA